MNPLPAGQSEVDGPETPAQSENVNTTRRLIPHSRCVNKLHKTIKRSAGTGPVSTKKGIPIAQNSSNPTSTELDQLLDVPAHLDSISNNHTGSALTPQMFENLLEDTSSLSLSAQVPSSSITPPKEGNPRLILRDLETNIFRQENKRKVLRILLNNNEQIACPDSGSTHSIMSEAFAIENNLTVSRQRMDFKPFELGSGARVWSVGRVKSNVELLGHTLRRKLRTFYVFVSCPVPLILGMIFLHQAEIFTKNKHMLEPCPSEMSRIPSLLWIGSPRRKRSSPCNRMKCTLDGRKLVAVADTYADLNFRCPDCAEREGFIVDTREAARRTIQFGDKTEAETFGEVYVANFSLDWREPVTKAPDPENASTEKLPSQPTEDSALSGIVFHVLPVLPCDVILGRDILEETDAFNRCSKLSGSLASGNKTPFEFNIMLNRKRKRKSVGSLLSAEEKHQREKSKEKYE